MSAIVYHQGDELPVWQEIVTVNGSTPDLSSGWTFTATLTRPGQSSVVKTEGIVGDTGGVVQVQWDEDELDIHPGTWRGYLVAKRDSDDSEWTARRRVYIHARATVVP